jgi:uncharacterized membrane protein AbrB (regulator of aidB expression)
VKITRLFQPRNPRFWLWVALNLLSAALAWMVQTKSLPVGVMLLLALFALGNAVLGTWLMVLLWRTEPTLDATVAPQDDPR